MGCSTIHPNSRRHISIDSIQTRTPTKAACIANNNRLTLHLKGHLLKLQNEQILQPAQQKIVEGDSWQMIQKPIRKFLQHHSLIDHNSSPSPLSTLAPANTSTHAQSIASAYPHVHAGTLGAAGGWCWMAAAISIYWEWQQKGFQMDRRQKSASKDELIRR
ncbi:hypothetical protein FGO68_gene1971 [Halteria grandinella]|uniref:Uncharacterized protein n=1 Tax=Halteria grandinella TaxID=5974 RepID=A0A8J8NK95_HALGN|nr:hypothetical protein FGO68_gene1971 [Halteria grandinella]